jgi:hypothetical protein
VFTVTAPPSNSILVTGINATTRSSTNGAQTFETAYNTGSGWVNSGSVTTPFSADLMSCGVSTVEDLFTIAGGGVVLAPAQSMTVAVVPYAALSTLGTTQINTIDVTGIDCPNPGSILDVTNGGNFNGKKYGTDCSVQVSCSPAGGTWGSSDPAVASVDGTTGLVTFGTPTPDPEDVVITYSVATACGFATSTATVTVESFSGVCDGASRHAAPTPGSAAAAVSGVELFPNPASLTLTITATEAVNVSILSMDGKTVITQNDAKTIDVSKLASGLYMVKIYNQKDVLIKTAKFTKE